MEKYLHRRNIILFGIWVVLGQFYVESFISTQSEAIILITDLGKNKVFFEIK